MKNKIYNYITTLVFSLLIFSNSNSTEQFNFEVTEVEIVEKGNLFLGQKRGTITTNEGLVIIGNEFEYNKKIKYLETMDTETVNRFQLSTQYTCKQSKEI